ncbi:AMP-binding protein [Streptomyces sp. NPDC005953]|uniref:AMP-binding protein n=1 Tax=Streptomyces sp. NPDC005953 TaxID=3156719 RepID=UPI0033D76E51
MSTARSYRGIGDRDRETSHVGLQHVGTEYWHQGPNPRCPTEDTLHGLFARQAALTPHHAALTHDTLGSSLSYAEVDKLSDHVAELLRERGIVPGERVYLSTEDPMEALPGLLGVLKAGAHVSVDLAAALTRPTPLRSPADVGDSEQGRPSPHAISDALRGRASRVYDGMGRGQSYRLDSDVVACVLEDARSVGSDRGVELTHRSVVGQARGAWQGNRVGSGDTLLYVPSRPLTVSVWELLLWTLEGVRVVLMSGGATGPENVVDAVGRYRATAVHLSPLMVRQVLGLAGHGAGDSTLRYVLCESYTGRPEWLGPLEVAIAPGKSGACAEAVVTTIPEARRAEQFPHGGQSRRTEPVESSPAEVLGRMCGLTHAETSVAKLVAEGLTNKEIAMRLNLSVHTVGTHVRNSFTKLDVTNRVALARKIIFYECDHQM